MFTGNISEQDHKVDTYGPKKPKSGHLGSKSEKRKLVENSRFPQFLYFGSFRLFAARFGSVRVLLSTILKGTNFLSNRKQRVVSNCQCYSWADICSSAPEGSII